MKGAATLPQTRTLADRHSFAVACALVQYCKLESNESIDDDELLLRAIR